MFFLCLFGQESGNDIHGHEFVAHQLESIRNFDQFELGSIVATFTQVNLVFVIVGNNQPTQLTNVNLKGIRRGVDTVACKGGYTV
jgi:hypothetical protein